MKRWITVHSFLCISACKAHKTMIVAIVVGMTSLALAAFCLLPTFGFLSTNYRPEEKAFSSSMARKSLLKIKSDDSIGTVLDLRDSLLFITCHNVALRVCPVLEYHCSPSLKALKQSGRINSYFDSSFTQETETATIPKVPIKVKKAPKDSLAAARESFMDTCSVPKKGDVAIRLRFNSALRIKVYQSEKYSSKSTAFSLPWFHSVSILVELMQSLKELFQGRILPVPKTITIVLSHDDAAILYRAFPTHGTLAILL
jgi:hypothetical protein